VEALLKAATAPEPPPIAECVAPDLVDQAPPDLGELLGLLPRADLYVQDEVQFDLHPTLTRVWCRQGRAGQRRVQAPGQNAKVHGFGLVDWRDGWFDGALAPRRAAAPFVEQLRRALARSQKRGRVAIVVADNARIHTPEGSLLVREVLAEYPDDLRLVYTPRYDPDAQPIEALWRVSRRTVTHTHQRRDLETLTADARTHFAWLAEHPNNVLLHIGSPFADATQAAPTCRVNA
jgi:transposase